MMKKIYILLGFLLITLAANLPTGNSQEEKPIFRYGILGGALGYIETIDPAQAWDYPSIDIIDQVCEGLLAYDLNDPEMILIPRLATDLGTWNAEAMEVTFILRQDVTFHDGTLFNATAVKYTFDRLNNLIEQEMSQIAKLYEPLAELYPSTPSVINETVVVSEFTVKFILNYPYVPFPSLLCFSGSYIIHPTMPFDRLIEMDEPLLGTGSYMLDYYTEEEIHFLAYSGYYRPQPNIQEMRWIKYDDALLLAQAFLVGEVDMPEGIHPDYIEEFKSDPNIHVDPPMTETCIYYLWMNHRFINQTFRQVISYAIDYNYIIANIMNNQVVRMTSVIPAGILFHDPTVILADYDLKHARQILVDHGLARGLLPTSSDLEWYNLAETAPITSFNYSYNEGNRVRGDIGLLIKNNLKLVGIKLDVWGLQWGWWPIDWTKFGITTAGYCPDYNDPSCIINPLMSNTSLSNIALINDPWLQNAMMQALAETNTTARRALYSAMQHYIGENLMPMAFLYTSRSVAAWNIQLGNVPRNPMGKRYFYPCTWYLATNTTITTPTNTTTSNTTSSDPKTFPSNPLEFISGNVKIILLSLCGVPIVLVYMFRKKFHLNHSVLGIGN